MQHAIVDVGTCTYEERKITNTNVRITVLWYILIQSKDMKAGYAMTRVHLLDRLIMEQEPILYTTVTSVL